jgi:ATP-dependent helicase/DNAse subunit B
MEEPTKNITYLSASKIKTYSSCSWQYYASYVLKIPQKGNSGASRGTIVHNLLELLAKPRHQHFIEKIWMAGTPEKLPPIKKFIEKQFVYENLSKEEEVKPIKVKYGKKNNWETVCEMIMTTLKLEFLSGSGKIIDSEYEFNLINENPRYAVRGFIDRVSEEDDGKTLKILDYKSSAKKFKGEEEESNIQAMIYSLVSRKIWKNYKNYKASFLFMRFPDDPYQHSEFEESELDGLEHYLEYITDILEKINEDSAKINLAASDKEKSWLCGRGKWICPYRDQLKFYKVIDNSEKKPSHVGSFFTKEEAEKKQLENANFSVEESLYAGCPAFKTLNEPFFP